MKFLLLIGLDRSNFLCTHELAIYLVDDGAVTLMADLEDYFLLVVRVALLMMLDDLFGDYL